MEFLQEFPDGDACLEWLWRVRYSLDGEHAYCPKCEAEKTFKRYATKQRRQSWACTTCGHFLHPTAGTIFHKSSTSLHLWFYTMHLMTSTRCEISAKQLERELGVTYKTAWRMANLIRNELTTQDDEPLSGEVEADETYVGGCRHGTKRGRPSEDSHKAPVFGMVERSGRVAAVAVRNAKTDTLMPYVRKRVLSKSVVYTDELRSYDALKKAGYQHKRIHHTEQVYVSGDVHTNTIEGFWSLMKRGINGVYHAVSAKHLQGYLNEYTFRHNHRSKAEVQFKKLLLRAALSP
ncbi:MAG: IS1595 family transposase [Rubrobacter sp.]|nr:IS1595 family transposase [Rubrobacter sp.]